MKRISLEISGRIDEVPENIGGWTHKPGEWRHWSGERLASDDLLDAILAWAERHGALATVMVRLADDATGGDDE